MDIELILLVLLAAFMHAGWNALVKSGAKPEFSIAAYRGFGILCVLALPFVPLPSTASWWFIFASVVVHNIYYFSLAQAYRVGDLSQVYPLFRGLAPVLVALGAWYWVGETLSAGGVAGVVLISLGLSSIALRRNDTIPIKALGWGLCTSALIASYTIIDGLGVRLSGNPLSYILWLFTFEALPIMLWLVFTQRKEWFDYLAASRNNIVLGGVISGAAYGIVIFAMSLGALALVSSLRETSVIFAVVIGAMFLKEPFGRQRVVSACLVALGVILIKVI